MRKVRWLAAILGIAGLAAWLTAQVSPWPSVLVLRLLFDLGGVQANAALAAQVPPGVGELRDQTYQPGQPDGNLDVFFPSSAGAAPSATVVWIHGGGFVSGSKGQVANYLRILASAGFTVVGVDYTPAPELHYPGQVRQLNAALAYLLREAGRLHVDAQHMVLAGDSAGAQLAAQLAILVSSPSYARQLGITPALPPGQLAGVILYCGPYAMNSMPRTWFTRTVGWAYSGLRDSSTDARGATLDLTAALTAGFPPAFMSVGNADPLAAQSVDFARALSSRGVRVERLFYPADHRPALGHEYQFDLRLSEAREALARSQQFVRGLR